MEEILISRTGDSDDRVIFRYLGIEDDDQYITHEGVARRSGRYPWGSGENPNQRNKTFMSAYEELKKNGLSETEIAEGLGMTTTQLRARKAVVKNETKQAQISEAVRLREKGYSPTEIGRKMGLNESSVRGLLDPNTKEKTDILINVSNQLRERMASGDVYLDIGAGTENWLGLSATKFNQAVAILKDEGYVVHKFGQDQLGVKGNTTNMKVLTPPGTRYPDILNNRDRIETLAVYSEDNGRTIKKILPPESIDLSRVGVRYGPDGGADMDGVIQVRRGVDDVSLGGSRYSQVRIGVNGTHYLKGMAVYSDDLPKGVDLMFNTNKSSTGNLLDAMKPMKTDANGDIDTNDPFGSQIRRQKTFIDKDGNERITVLNIVNDEGDWREWSSKLSSQMLSKQTTQLAKQQLGLGYDIKKAEFDEIMSLTNPSVKKRLLQSFSDDADASSVHLKAAGLPRTRTHVILPITDIKPTEIYAPSYKNGEKVVLIRHPHGGIFEIPELTVNNKHKGANGIIGGALDAVGIHPKVAEKLSGADFDGDTVLVIPNNTRGIKTSKSLEGLKGFDPKTAYPKYDGMKVMTKRGTQQQMGDITNLITDMTIKGATESELAKAVRHSMVVIDAEKHKLNYKQSSIDNDIRSLKAKYQGGENNGASTVISRARSKESVLERTPRKAKDGGPIDKETGRLIYEETGRSYIRPGSTRVLKNGTEKVTPEKTVYNKQQVIRMLNTNDAHTLSSGTPMEVIYADHANSLKALANQARKEMVNIKELPYSPSAKAAYSKEVQSLNAKLDLAQRNAPLERKAQLIAKSLFDAKLQSNPDMDNDDQKKERSKALEEARLRTGAKKNAIRFTDSEWAAVQSGAITPNKLNDILRNADLDSVKQLAMPRTVTGMSTPMLNRAKSMANSGYTRAEIADALGVSETTVNNAVNGG